MATEHTLASNGLRARVASLRECPFCGASVSRALLQCSSCRETMPPASAIEQAISRPASVPKSQGSHLRQGLLCMLLAGVIRYFAGGYTAMSLPFAVSSLVTIYFAPTLFLLGLGLIVRGFFSRSKS